MKVDIEAKLKRWEQRLLDLGKRNPNLNFRFNKTSTLEIKEPEINLLWENLVDDEKVMSFGIYRENIGIIWMKIQEIAIMKINFRKQI